MMIFQTSKAFGFRFGFCRKSIEKHLIVQIFVPHWAVFQVVTVIAEELGVLRDGLERPDAENPAKTWVRKIAEATVWEEGMIDLVSQGGAILAQVPLLWRNVQNLLLLLVQADLVRIVLPIIKSL